MECNESSAGLVMTTEATDKKSFNNSEIQEAFTNYFQALKLYFEIAEKTNIIASPAIIKRLASN